jgi:hypothetical protein
MEERKHYFRLGLFVVVTLTILAADPENQLARRMLGLTITDQFEGQATDRYADATLALRAAGLWQHEDDEKRCAEERETLEGSLTLHVE